MARLTYRNVDVFASGPISGNRLPVFVDPSITETGFLLAITQKLRNFETVFVWPTGEPQRWITRVFDLLEELPFAGHPVLGAAAVLHERSDIDQPLVWDLVLPGRTVSVTTELACAGQWKASMVHGNAEFGDAWTTTHALAVDVAAAFSLDLSMLRPDLPMRVVSTGLRYLIVPVRAEGLASAKVIYDLTDLLPGIGAQFAVLLDPDRPEARHWANDGSFEDVATGSAAGAIAAYLRSLERIPPAAPLILHQGRFTARPSELIIEASGSGNLINGITVGGMVRAVKSKFMDIVI